MECTWFKLADRGRVGVGGSGIKCEFLALKELACNLPEQLSEHASAVDALA